jgi:hypothetical protein
MNLVTASRSAGFSVTVNVHCAVRELASLAVQATVVEPTGNVVPEPGVHVMPTGCVPPLTVGTAKLTAWLPPTTPDTLMLAGQATDGGAPGGVGLFGPPQQTATRSAIPGARLRTNRSAAVQFIRRFGAAGKSFEEMRRRMRAVAP